MHYYSIFLTTIAGFLVSPTSFAKNISPCAKINRNLSADEKIRFERALVSQLKKKDMKDIQSVEVLKSFHFRSWRILYVNTFVSDEPFLFYNAEPSTHPYVTLWSGAAMTSEENEIYKWTVANAKGIPSELAHCFAFHVTKDRGN